MSIPIKVAILEDHQGIVDGYMFRLRDAGDIEITAVSANGDELDSMLRMHPEIDTLIMDIHVPVSADDGNTIPILHLVPKILEARPKIQILIISMVMEPSLIKALVDAGISGYIFKDDSDSIRRLPAVLRMISKGELYLSEDAKAKLQEAGSGNKLGITNRQLEILSLCAAYPDLSSDQLADRLGVASSSLRTTLSETYFRLNVHTKAAAISKARELGLIP